MTKHHYVYHSYEEWGRDYIGRRTCNCLPEEDIKYFGSFKDKTFSPTEKTILFVCETPEEIAEIEIKLHDFFDVAVNPQFANQAKQTSTGFDRTGVPNSAAQKKAESERKSGEKNPMYGVPRTKVQKKAVSEKLSGEKNPQHGNTGGLNHNSKAIIAIQPDGTELHFGSGWEAARELGIPQSSLRYSLKNGKQPKKGKCEGWRFVFENPQGFAQKNG